MQDTNKVPNVPISDFKKTKIVATVGPATDSYEKILELMKAGANGLRLNFSHGTYDERIRQIKWIRKASKAYGKPVAIIADMQGPKIRLGDFDGVIPVQTGQDLVLEYGAKYEESGHIPIQYDLAKKVKRGERLYIFDGKVRTTVTNVKDKTVHVHVENDGILLKRKGINLPDTDFGGDVLTEKDKADISFCSTQDIDYVAQSFVQSADDIRSLRKILRSLNMDVRIIVKFETRAAVGNMDEIVRTTDVIMVARGDLAVETEPESVPMVQRQLISLGRKYAKPVIVATQMLVSMTEAPEPTRAEVSDVATAVVLGADAVMLSDETANGKYPIEAVKFMKRVILYTQTHVPGSSNFPVSADEGDASKQGAISSAVLTLADKLDARAIVAETLTGSTALQISSKRPQEPIIAVTSSARTVHQLGLVYGVKSYLRPADKYAATKLTDWLYRNKALTKGDMVVIASGQYPGVVGTTDTIKVRVIE